MSDHNNKNNSNTKCIAVHHSDLGINLMEGHHKPITGGTCEMETKMLIFINILSLSIYAGTAAGATQVFVAHSLNVSQPGHARFINLCHFQPFWPRNLQSLTRSTHTHTHTSNPPTEQNITANLCVNVTS